ncbi:ComEC family protein [Yersinia ruckeri]|uniref:ComEC family protein n=1 Tax=Yersinia ruckeri TaxID=29486 RepID=UPI0020C0BC7E|nr:ComEC family protein [Yersinia ruckeri]MCK8564805.1 ComEC family protein [Yersinia ruckeri]MCK8584081.1 ComEC family protein [Yersinia ruckeri]MCW6538032.1 ComEC family protein [Yersinia ruckeri]MCW6636221.1 ComEC family protein [Yersinia ruckeri]UZX66413.1 ComEC family protein [Yersinia ruckeri]
MLPINQIATAIIIGLLPLIFLPQLPGFISCSLLLVFALLFWFSRNNHGQFIALAILAFIWGCWNANTLVDQIEKWVKGDQWIVATVKSISLIHGASHTAKVLLNIESVAGQRVFPPIAVSVAWPDQYSQWCAGQRWQFKIRMKAVHSLLNEGGFDSQRWAAANRRPLFGRIIDGKLLDGHCNLRQRIILRVEQQLEPYTQRHLLMALAFGERAGLSKNVWQILRHTGTAHLMAISGLHIVMAALFGHALVRAVQYLLPSHWIRPVFPLIAGWLVALMYAWLAGANPPAVRAALALSLWLALRLSGVLCSSWQIWLWAVGLILLSEPLSVLSDSFWLSCLAVFSLIFWFQWAPMSSHRASGHYGLLFRWLHVQLGMMLLLAPLQIGLFHGISLSAIPANLWAVPIVSFITVPTVLLALISSASTHLAELWWWASNASLTLAMLPLDSLSQSWLPRGGDYLALSFIGWFAIVIWRFQWWRSHPVSVLVLCINLIFLTSRRDMAGWRVDMLDIGHGLAVVIERRQRAVVFDTGNRWKQGSMADKVILPYLNWRGLRVEQIILSHDHQDHTGGVYALRAEFPSATIRAPFIMTDNGRPMATLPCRQGEQWQWQDLHFEVLWPPQIVVNAQNDDSCVIRVSDGKHSLLLPGDLEAKSELLLVKQFRNKLKSTLLQVPHHGSNTSSTAPFLRAIKPELALASVARYNQWHLPTRKVVNRYKKNGIIWRDTSVSGQLSVDFSYRDWRIKGYREQLFPRWYHQRFGVEAHNE